MALEKVSDERWESSATKAVDTDWFDSDIATRTGHADKFVIQMMVPTSTIVNLQIKNDSITKVFDLNEGVALTANAGYQFTVLLGPGYSFNIQHKTGTQNVAATVFTADNLDL